MEIRELSELTNIPSKTIRYYEEIELLPPPKRKPNDYREYSEFDVDRLKLVAGARLSLDSRAWITGELASAYPGAGLIHPDWGIEGLTECGWAGDTCVITFTGTLATADPGWYDITLTGSTSGTLATPPRSFDDVGGTFGVFMLDNTALTQ